MPGVKCIRQSFTFEYKLKVIACADEIGNWAVAREFEINESVIHYWWKKKVIMTKLPKCQRTCCTDIAKFPALERTFKEWIISRRENSHTVTAVMIRLKAKELSRQMNVAYFVGGPSWCSRFMHWNRLSVRLRTTVWVRSCRKTGKRGDPCPSSTEPLCSSSTVSAHILTKVFATLSKLNTKQLPQWFLKALPRNCSH